MRRLTVAVVALFVGAVSSAAAVGEWRAMPERTRWAWYGGPRDSGDNNQTASGISNAIPGIARYNRSTLGDYFVVGHGGQRWLLRQIEIGPHPDTGRGLDVNYSAVPLFGYRENNFPTDATAEVIHVGKDLRTARARALALGARIPGYRMYGGAASPDRRSLATGQEGSTPMQAAGGAQGAVQGGSGGDLAQLMAALLGQRQRPAVSASPLPNPFFSTLNRDYLRPRV